MSSSSTAYAIFTACEKSNEFEERRVPLIHNSRDPTKIGRAVARLRASSDNMIFDCKVLSRTHAVIYYDDDRFYLRDTKSSNGTFVNNERMSKGGEEAAPRVIFSGDIVQLGVDITENNKNATFSCIIAIAKLVHPDGREAIRPDCPAPDSGLSSAHSVDGATPSGAALTAMELFQLHQYIKEAAHREQSLRAKLKQLEELLDASHTASDSTWQALIDEDRLLSRIETLEGRIALMKRTTNEDKMRDELEQMVVEKEEYENKAKASVKKILQEKLEVMQKLTDVERALMATERQTDRTGEECNAAKIMLQQLDEKYIELQTKHVDADTELQKLRAQHGDVESSTRSLKDENVTLKVRETGLNEQILKLMTQLNEKVTAAENTLASTELKDQLEEREMELVKANASLSTSEERIAELAKSEQTWREQASVAANEAHEMKELMDELKAELRNARSEKFDTEAAMLEMQTRLDRYGDGDTLHRVYEELRARCDSVTLLSAVCLFVVFIAVVMAFNPFFSTFTATNEQANEAE